MGSGSAKCVDIHQGRGCLRPQGWGEPCSSGRAFPKHVVTRFAFLSPVKLWVVNSAAATHLPTEPVHCVRQPFSSDNAQLSGGHSFGLRGPGCNFFSPLQPQTIGAFIWNSHPTASLAPASDWDSWALGTSISACGAQELLLDLGPADFHAAPNFYYVQRWWSTISWFLCFSFLLGSFWVFFFKSLFDQILEASIVLVACRLSLAIWLCLGSGGLGFPKLDVPQLHWSLLQQLWAVGRLPQDFFIPFLKRRHGARGGNGVRGWSNSCVLIQSLVLMQRIITLEAFTLLFTMSSVCPWLSLNLKNNELNRQQIPHDSLCIFLGELSIPRPMSSAFRTLPHCHLPESVSSTQLEKHTCYVSMDSRATMVLVQIYGFHLRATNHCPHVLDERSGFSHIVLFLMFL